MNIEWIIGLIAAAFTLAGVLFGVFKWVLKQSEDRINSRFDDHGEKIKINTHAIKENEKLLIATRDEMHRDYVPHRHFNNVMNEIRGDVREIFKRIDAMSSKLNRWIGRNTRGHDDEL